MSALELLIGDHNRVRGSFSRFTSAKESEHYAEEEEQEMFPKVRSNTSNELRMAVAPG